MYVILNGSWAKFRLKHYSGDANQQIFVYVTYMFIVKIMKYLIDMSLS
jgi:hypothetical protein